MSWEPVASVWARAAAGPECTGEPFNLLLLQAIH